MPTLAARQTLLAGSFGATLPEIQARVQRIVRGLFPDRPHFVCGAINRLTLAPYTLADMADYDVRKLFTVNAGCPHEAKLLVMNHEEADMATGDYLLSLVHQYRVTGEERVRASARRVFEAILRLVENAATKNPYGRGWLPRAFAFELLALSGHHFTSWLHGYWKLERLGRN